MNEYLSAISKDISQVLRGSNGAIERIGVFGSVLNSPESANDIDIVVTAAHGRVDETLRHVQEAKWQWPVNCVDIESYRGGHHQSATRLGYHIVVDSSGDVSKSISARGGAIWYPPGTASR